MENQSDSHPLMEKSSLDVDRQTKSREFQKNIYFCFVDYTKDFDCVDHNTLWKIRQEMGIPSYALPDSWETCMQVKKQ